MAQDYTESKVAVGGAWKPGQIDSIWVDVEPLVTPQMLRDRHLFGVPLYSGAKDPVTGVRQALTDPIIQDQIAGAVSDAEIETHIDIFPRKYKEKQAFDRPHYQAFGYFKLAHRPVTSVDILTVTTAEQQDVFTVPLEWLDAGHMTRGQINLIPMGVALSTSGSMSPNGVITGQSAGGAAFLAILGNQPWIASFWQIQYTTGFFDGMLPRPVNDLVGVIAAMRILSMLAATHARVTGASLGLDGVSQSVSGPGGQLFASRLQELGIQRKTYVKKLRAMYGTNLFSNHV